MKPLLVQLLLEYCDDDTSLLFSREKRPDCFSFFLLFRFSSPLIIFLALLWTPSSLSDTFWNCGDENWTQPCRCSQTGTQRSGMSTSLSLPVTALWRQPRMPWLLHTAKSCSACVHQQPQGSLSKAAPQPHFIKLHTTLACPLWQPGQAPVWEGFLFWHVHLNHPG